MARAQSPPARALCPPVIVCVLHFSQKQPEVQFPATWGPIRRQEAPAWVPSRVEYFKGCLWRATRDWVARKQSLRTLLAGSEMRGFRPRLGWVHPLLRAAPCAIQLLPDIQWARVVRFRGSDPPQAIHSPGAPPANHFTSTSKKGASSGESAAAGADGGGSPRLADSEGLPRWIPRSKPSAAASEHWICFVLPPCPAFSEHHPTSQRGCAHARLNQLST